MSSKRSRLTKQPYLINRQNTPQLVKYRASESRRCKNVESEFWWQSTTFGLGCVQRGMACLHRAVDEMPGQPRGNLKTPRMLRFKISKWYLKMHCNDIVACAFAQIVVATFSQTVVSCSHRMLKMPRTWATAKTAACKNVGLISSRKIFCFWFWCTRWKRSSPPGRR